MTRYILYHDGNCLAEIIEGESIEGAISKIGSNLSFSPSSDGYILYNHYNKRIGILIEAKD